MKEISPTGRDFQSLNLEKCICNPRITLLQLYLAFVPSVSPEGSRVHGWHWSLKLTKILTYQKNNKYSPILREDKLQTCPKSIPNQPFSNKQAQELQFAC